MLESGHDIWIVRKNDISAGYGIGHRDNSDEYYADMVYVHPDMREQGIGKIIQETMMKYATLRGYTTFVSSVTANNIASIRMQQSLAMEFLPMKKGKGFNLRKKLNG